ncbi:MAG: substrate-binding domain-containing protein [Fulvimarina manganoxydans]|uniref:substrate-binding domain-containing protein n=1 Tax=Fulvimarina manganoxydans TaxID=937218 RepID=UPI0023525907|nr:substrate-binding domain-containing protein [Fulvimarina manganoxydans]MCK5934187.1 substrate-binding domain-containing protein [Fulvimarina manganoxydans]
MSIRSIIASGIAGALALAVPFLVLGPASAQDREFGGEIELVDPDVFRVCADPNNMPFSNEAEEGFEQKVAELLAGKLGRSSVSYAYFPQATGFVRMTLGSQLCDVIMSYPQGDELVQNTNAYYRTAYALVVPADGDLANVEKLSDPALQGKRVGVVAGTPPATYLARAGLIGKAKPYQLMVDTRIDNSAKAMIDDLDKGNIDAATLWGPMAGWYAKQSDKDYKVIPLIHEGAGPATTFRITMGVRPADQQWKRTLNVAIRDNQDAINDILLSYGVPLLTEDDQLIQPSKDAAAGTESGNDSEQATDTAAKTGSDSTGKTKTQ